MKVLIACEYSGIIRDAFAKKGHNAWSCDLLQCDKGGQHIQDDAIKTAYNQQWDLMIAHPPCTYLSYAGNAWWNDPGRCFLRLDAARFFLQLYHAPIERICIENPLGIMEKIFRKSDQSIHPYYFGESELKRTCLWLKNLKKLEFVLKDNLFGTQTATEYPCPKYYTKKGKKLYFTESNQGSHKRSKSFESIAKVMADQWG